MLIVDTHAHVYSPDEKRYPPIENPRRPPAGAGTLEHVQKEMRAAGVAGVCAIQTSSFYGFDNRYVLDLSKAHPGWLAGVCTLDPDDRRSPAMLRRFVREYGVKGMRSIPADGGRLEHPGVEALWRTAIELDIPVNLHIGADKAPEAGALLRKYPVLRVVLDHCLYPNAGPRLEATLASVLHLERHRNLHAKLTFVPTGSWEEFPFRDMHEACLRIVGAYGSERCVWGSNFPLELWAPKVSYAEHVRIFTEVLPLKDTARAEILGGTANRLWFSGALKSHA